MKTISVIFQTLKNQEKQIQKKNYQKHFNYNFSKLCLNYGQNTSHIQTMAEKSNYFKLSGLQNLFVHTFQS